MTTPRVSILIPTYNRSAFLRQAIQSALAQSYQNLEILIMDDASTDQSAETIRDLLEDPRLHYVKHPINVGITANRNSGLVRARGEYVAMLDSDDVWLDDAKLRAQVEFLDGHPRCAMVGTHARILDPDGRPIGALTPPTDPDEIRGTILLRNPFVHSSVLLRKRALDRAGWYDTSIPIWEDYELWLRLGKTGELGNLPKLMTGYRRHPGGISRTAGARSIVSYWRIYRRHRKQYPYGGLLWLKAAILSCRYCLRHPISAGGLLLAQ